MRGRREGRANESRERILDSAARSFTTYGYRHSTFEEIARDAGVSRTLIYRHFDNKMDLLRAVRERALGQWAESVARAAAPQDTALAALEATIGETLRFASARPDFRAFLSGDTRLALYGHDRSGRLSREGWREQIAAILERGVGRGEFAPDLDTHASADVLCAMQLGVIDQMHQVGDPSFVLGPHHIAAASRILVTGVTSRQVELSDSGATA